MTLHYPIHTDLMMWSFCKVVDYAHEYRPYADLNTIPVNDLGRHDVKIFVHPKTKKAADRIAKYFKPDDFGDISVVVTDQADWDDWAIEMDYYGETIRVEVTGA